MAKGNKSEHPTYIDDFLTRLGELSPKGDVALAGGKGGEDMYGGGVQIRAYGHVFSTLLEGYFVFPRPVPDFVDELRSLVSPLLPKVGEGEPGFGHVVDPPFVYVFRVEKVLDYTRRPYSHIHFVKLDLRDYLAYHLNPLDFKDVLLNYDAFVRLYNSGKLDSFVKGQMIDLRPKRSVQDAFHREVEVYRVGELYAVTLRGDTDVAAEAVFRLVKEVYYTNVVIGFPVDPSTGSAKDYVAILPEGLAGFRYPERLRRVDLSDLRSHLRERIKERFGKLVSGLGELTSELKRADDINAAKAVLNKAERVKSWLDSVGLDRFFDYSDAARLIQWVRDFLENGTVRREIADYPFVTKELTKAVSAIASQCFSGGCSQNEVEELVDILSLKPELFESLAEGFDEAYEKATKEGRKLSIQFVQYMYPRDPETARKLVSHVLRRVKGGRFSIAPRGYADQVGRAFDLAEFVNLFLSIDNRLLEEYQRGERELEKNLEEECNKIKAKLEEELMADTLKKIFNEYGRMQERGWIIKLFLAWWGQVARRFRNGTEGTFGRKRMG